MLGVVLEISTIEGSTNFSHTFYKILANFFKNLSLYFKIFMMGHNIGQNLRRVVKKIIFRGEYEKNFQEV